MVFRSVGERRVKHTCREETSGSVMDHSKLMMLRHTYTGDDSSAVATVVAELTHRHFTAVLEIRAFLPVRHQSSGSEASKANETNESDLVL